MSETLRSSQAEQAGYEQTKTIIEALERGVPETEIASALEGRPTPKTGRKLERCAQCSATGYAGSYPFSTGYGRLCDDCGA